MTSDTSVVCILGATGTGKTAAALHLCDAFGAAVVNVDSRQMYRGLEIVTAQPTAEEQARCPHHLYGFLDPCQKVDAGAFTVLAENAVAEAAVDGLLPLLVGGTGMYLDALLYGLAPVPDVPGEVRHQIQSSWEALGPDAMYGFLERIDPDYAAKVHKNDRQRITRALEVYETTGRVFSSYHREHDRTPRYRTLKIGLGADLDALTPRLASRIDAMLEAGAALEMQKAWHACPMPDAPGFTGIGSRELLEYNAGRMSLSQAKTMWQRRTRAYAKRQMTWFRRDPEIVWFEPDDLAGIEGAVADFLG